MNNSGLGTLILFIIALTLVINIFGFVIRKLLCVKRRKWFSYNHLNERHKKLDWSVRIIFTILLISSAYYTSYNDKVENYWYLETWFILILFILFSEMLRAFIEWKYAENKKDFIATIVEMLFVISTVFLTITTDFFGLLNI